jgi:hypothetical protein
MDLERIFQAHESEKNLEEFLLKLVLSLVFLLTISYIISQNEAFAQMESMTIEGPKRPLVNSVFNVYVDVEGVSRASYGIFRMVMTIYEKNSGEVMVAVPDYLLSGINTIQINMIPDRNIEPLKEGISYILKIQHVNIISQHEFIPIKITND